MEAPRVISEHQVIYCDTDCGGVVSNIAYLRFVEAARVKLGEALGFSLETQAERGEWITVVRTEIDYKRGAKLGQQLQVSATVGEVDRVRFWAEFEIRHGDNLIANARQQLAIVKLPEGKPLRVPDKWKES
ncbi:MAG: thioesterase family protein [Verrucomicrobiota bacterium]